MESQQDIPKLSSFLSNFKMKDNVGQTKNHQKNNCKAAYLGLKNSYGDIMILSNAFIDSSKSQKRKELLQKFCYQKYKQKTSEYMKYI